MSLESGRAIVQGIMILVFLAIALSVSMTVGMTLVAVMGVLKLQESVTNWCPSDLILKPLGLKRRGEAART